MLEGSGCKQAPTGALCPGDRDDRRTAAAGTGVATSANTDVVGFPAAAETRQDAIFFFFLPEFALKGWKY